MGDADFRAHFERFGPVSDAVVMVDRSTQRSRGFGFVTFVEESSARACAATRHHELHGTFIDVREDEKWKARIEQYAPAPPAPAPIGLDLAAFESVEALAGEGLAVLKAELTRRCAKAGGTADEREAQAKRPVRAGGGLRKRGWRASFIISS